MKSSSHALATAAVVFGLTVSACGGATTDTGNTSEVVTTAPTTTTAQTAPSPAAESDVRSLVPTPADVQTSNGPDPIADNGIHLYFAVSGAPAAVMAGYRTALEGKGWDVTTIVSSTGGDGGGATYTATNGAAYGVVDGGGYGNTTYLNVCAWPTQPAEPNCGRSR